MAKDIGWHRAMSAAMRRSAEARKCPECGRHGAIVRLVEPTRSGEVCRWARDSNGRLCAYPGEFIER